MKGKRENDAENSPETKIKTENEKKNKKGKSMCIFCEKRLTSRMSNFMTDPEENETFYARTIHTSRHLSYIAIYPYICICGEFLFAHA